MFIDLCCQENRFIFLFLSGTHLIFAGFLFESRSGTIHQGAELSYVFLVCMLDLNKANIFFHMFFFPRTLPPTSVRFFIPHFCTYFLIIFFWQKYFWIQRICARPKSIFNEPQIRSYQTKAQHCEPFLIGTTADRTIHISNSPIGCSSTWTLSFPVSATKRFPSTSTQTPHGFWK